MPEGHLSDGGKQAVTVLGLGAMGSALAETLLGAGHPVTVWNRSSGKAEPLVERGAVRAGSAAEAIAASRLVLVCLLDYRSVHEVLDAGAVSGKVLVNVTNGTPAQARELAGWAAEHDADYLDGGIMAVPPMIGGPGAFLLYSGSRAAFDTYRGPLTRSARATISVPIPGSRHCTTSRCSPGCTGCSSVCCRRSRWCAAKTVR